MLTLYHLFLSSHSRKIRIVLREKGLEFELKAEKTWERRPEFLALNPAGEVPVLVVRNDESDDVTVMIERCGHQTVPLGQGEVVSHHGDDCIVCPWHGSTFRLSDGAVVHGPAASSQPLLRTRVIGGRVEASLP